MYSFTGRMATYTGCDTSNFDIHMEWAKEFCIAKTLISFCNLHVFYIYSVARRLIVIGIISHFKLLQKLGITIKPIQN